MTKRYYGRETITSRRQAIDYLLQNYVDADQNPISEEDAMAACLEHKKEIDDGISPFGSNVHYVGDQIGRAKGWIELEEDEEDLDYDERDEEEDY